MKEVILLRVGGELFDIPTVLLGRRSETRNWGFKMIAQPLPLFPCGNEPAH